MRTATRITLTGLALLTAVGLAGCAGSDNAAEPTDTATTTVTATPQPTPSATASSTPTAPASTGTGGTGGTGTGTVAECATSNLTGVLGRNLQGGSAGHTHYILTLVNKGASCTLQGWPGTSLVGTSGNQLGAAASFVTSSPHATVTLAPNADATADISVAQAGDYGSSCTQSPAKGFRIYPPGQKAALFVDGTGFGLVACTQTSISLLTVTALQPSA